MKHILYPLLFTGLVMVGLFVFLMLLQEEQRVLFGADSGATSPGTSAEDTSVGDTAWTNYSNVLASDNAYTTCAGGAAGAGAFSSVKLVKGGTISGNEKSTGTALTTTDTYYSYGGAADLWGLAFTADDINAATFGVAASLTNGSDICYYIKTTNYGFAIPTTATIDGILVGIEAKSVESDGFTTFVDHIRITVYYTAITGGPPIAITKGGTVNVQKGGTIIVVQ